MNPSVRTGTRWLTALTIAFALWATTPRAYAESLAVIVNRNNPITSLTNPAVADMYRGEILHWPNGDRVKLVNRDISAETRRVFYLRVLNARPDQVFYREGTPIPIQSVIERTEDAVVRFVGVIEGAIGYVTLTKLKTMRDDQVKVVLIVEDP
ncbi:MAG: hypothetical protein IPM58_03980 [Nitrospira sp.]|nr:hypothetical protein [Nitrospira sp.]